jgi:hypothetical protein
MADRWEKTHLDAHEYIFRLAGLFEPTIGDVYRMIEIHAFTHPCMITLSLQPVPTIALHSSRLKWLAGQRKDWYSQVFDSMRTGTPLPDTLPDHLGIFSERRALTNEHATSVAQLLKSLEMDRLVNAGDGFAKDGYHRRGYMQRVNHPPHSFDDYGGTLAEARQNYPQVLSFFDCLYQLASRTLQEQESITQLRSL